MAWPPPTLPINRTNATPQLDTHAADHNAVNLAINDTVAELGANPSGTRATVDARFLAEGIQNHIGGVNHFANGEGFQIQAASTVITTDANGNAAISFPYAFAVLPVVTVCNGDAAGGAWLFSVHYGGMTVANFTVRVNNPTTGANMTNGTFRVNWTALCPRNVP